MTNTQFTLLAWCALLTHVAVGIVMWRRLSELPLVATVNMLVALGIVGYAMSRWYGNVARGVVWNWADQFVPLYGIIALAVALLALTDRAQVTWPNTVVFIVNLVASAAAVFFVSSFRMNRLF